VVETVGVEPIEYFSLFLPISPHFSVKHLEFQWVERETLAITGIHRFPRFFKTDSETDSIKSGICPLFFMQ